MIPLNYHHLYYFYVIAKSGSIVRACDTLLLAQPTLSAQLKQLEKALGCALFERRRQRLFLTDDGRFVLDYAESIFELGQELQDAIRDRAPQGKLDIQFGVLNGTSRAFSHALVDCALSCPHAGRVSVRDGSLDTLVSDLREHHIDALLSDVSVPSREAQPFDNHLLARLSIVFAARTAWEKKIRRFPDDLATVPLLIPSAGPMHQRLMDLFARWKIKPTIVAEVPDAEIARQLALSGRGVAALNTQIAVTEGMSGLRVIGGKTPTGIFESLYLVTRPRKRVHPVVDYVRKHFALDGSSAVLRSRSE